MKSLCIMGTESDWINALEPVCVKFLFDKRGSSHLL